MESLTLGYQGSLRSRIQQAAPLIFNFEFPLATGVSRLALETKILAHYYTREIGCETYGLWQFWLENRMNEIMPYYNQLYDTVNRDFDYLKNVDLWEDLDETSNKNENVQYGEQETVDHTQSDTLNFTGEETIDNTAKQVTDSTVDTEGNTTGNSESNGTTTATDNSINSDYPQAQLSETDYATSGVNSNTQGTSKDTTESTTDSAQTQTTSATTDNTANQTKDTTNKQTLARTNDTERKRNTNNDLIGKYAGHHVRHTAGLNGNKTYVELMQEYRDALINIDMMIINELSDLFMLIY